MIRLAVKGDLDGVAAIYDAIHDEEENVEVRTGWQRGIYPTRDTAAEAFERGDLYVMEIDGKVVAAAVINKIQVDVYEGAPWQYIEDDDKVLVIHTLVVDPRYAGRGYGRSFVCFYEGLATEIGCSVLRLDTNEKNRPARNLYGSMGYKEVDIVHTVFNGLSDVNLVLLEKRA